MCDKEEKLEANEEVKEKARELREKTPHITDENIEKGRDGEYIVREEDKIEDIF